MNFCQDNKITMWSRANFEDGVITNKNITNWTMSNSKLIFKWDERSSKYIPSILFFSYSDDIHRSKSFFFFRRHASSHAESHSHVWRILHHFTESIELQLKKKENIVKYAQINKRTSIAIFFMSQYWFSLWWKASRNKQKQEQTHRKTIEEAHIFKTIKRIYYL